MPKIHPVYFTCSDHFEELKVSLTVLNSVAKEFIGNVYIYCDLEDYFKHSQLKALKKICPVIIRKTAAPMSWGGIKTVENELVGFNEIRKEVEESDLILNIDADTVVISKDIFSKAVSDLEADVIGSPVNTHFMASWDNSLRGEKITFQQGSFYFVRAALTLRMIQGYANNRQQILSEVARICFVPHTALPSDVTMSYIFKAIKANIKYYDFMVDSDKSVIHMELTKGLHWKPFGKLMGLQKTGNHVVLRDNNINKIPKKIHYCWFGRGEKPELIKRCIDSWHKFLPDYEIKEWNEDNSPMSEPYMQKVYGVKSWTNVSDFVRLYVLYEEGGIYLDTDIEVVKSFDDLLNEDVFLGFQFDKPPFGTGSESEWVNGAVMGGVKGQELFKTLMNAKNKNFNGNEPPSTAGPGLITNILRDMGLVYDSNATDNITHIKNITIFPKRYFYPHSWNEKYDSSEITKDTYCIHHWTTLWKKDYQIESKDGYEYVTQGHLGGYTLDYKDSYVPKLWQWAIDTLEINSVLDIGCAEGQALKFFHDQGCMVLGIDGCDKAIRDNLMPENVIKADLCEGYFSSGKLFDMAWCCEVVEHIEERYVENILKTFQNAKWVFMTHAKTGREGYHHVNCQESQYWIDLLEKNGFKYCRELTGKGRSTIMNEFAFFKQSGLIFRNKGIK